MSNKNRRQALQAAGLAHPRPDAVTAPLFHAGDPFFFALDKVQVKYEMLRAHFGEGDTVSEAARMATPAPSSTWWLPRSSKPG